MASNAFATWQADRLGRIELARSLVSPVATGAGSLARRLAASSVLLVRLVSEFQGFARDLHDEASDYLATRIAVGNAKLANVLQTRFTTGRKLDQGNPNPGALGSDFGALGLILWPTLTMLDARATDWNEQLELLLVARNGIVHADPSKLEAARRKGFKVNATQLKKSEKTINLLAAGMDQVTGAYLQGLLGGGAPW